MDLDKILTSLNESAEEDQVTPAPTMDDAIKSLKLTPPQQAIVKNMLTDLPSNVSSQVRILLGQGVRWMTFEDLLKALIQIITASGTKTVSAANVPALDKAKVTALKKSEGDKNE